MSREETTLRSMCAPHLRPLIALSQRFRRCAGASVLLKTPGAYTRVPGCLLVVRSSVLIVLVGEIGPAYVAIAALNRVRCIRNGDQQ